MITETGDTSGYYDPDGFYVFTDMERPSYGNEFITDLRDTRNADRSSGTSWLNWLLPVFGAANQVLTYQQQRELNEINMDRARAGRAPLTAAQIGMQSPPSPQMPRNTGMTTGTIAVLALVAAAGVYMLTKKGR